MFNYECDYSEDNSFQTSKQEIKSGSVVARINPRLLCERKQFGVCSGGAVFCDNRGDVSLANPCGRRRTARIFSARTDLIEQFL